MKATLTFTWIQIKRMFRDKMAMFFTIVFPLIFLFVFGTIFSNSSNAQFDIAIINNAGNDFTTEFIKSFEKKDSLKIVDVSSLDDAKEKMGRGEIDSIIEVPAGFGEPNDQQIPHGELAVYYDEAEPQAGQTLASVMSGVLDEINIGVTKIEPPFKVVQKSTTTTGVSQFDYTFAGLLAFSMMTMSIFGLSNQLPSEKKTGALRRIKATPFRPRQIIIGMTLSYLVLTIVSLSVMIVVGTLAFDFDMHGNWLILAAFAILGALVMSGFGMAVAGWARNENQSAPLTQIIAFPMMFLSGTFFPRFIMPEWLQSITNWIPLTPVSDGVRMIVTENAGIVELLPQIGLLGAWGLVIYLIAFRVFRWE
ncbi:MAG: ABC transporter permease [Candidatus Nomurabacteria bacterium]|jgi:ABC-2 type transport system permease protein|nr:ABC transporter permease [Candidatus Nomurabacteria bacterium]